MRKYELMYIVNANLEEEARTALIERMHAILTDHGATLENVDEWGLREFAYEINFMKQGYYVVTTFSAPDSTGIDEFDRIALINKDIVRHLIIKLDEEE